MSEQREFLVETDLLVEHLIIKEDSSKSGLEKAMEKGICFTTMINSSEMYFAVRTKDEKDSVDKLMRALKILGLNSRYSLIIGDFAGKVKNVRDAIICAAAKINKLPILTNNVEKFRFTGLNIIHSKDL